MADSISSNNLHRSVKLALDTGEAATVGQAVRIFEGYRLGIIVGPELAGSATHQAALLTAVNTGRRAFLGGVQVAGPLDVPLLVPWRRHRTLREAVTDLQASVVGRLEGRIPRIVIGEAPVKSDVGSFAVRATFDGWRGGIIPLADRRRMAERHEFTPAGVLAGALAVSEAFQFVRGDNPIAGKRDVGLSLWQPDLPYDWSSTAQGPELKLLPSQAWLVGLGHLGQAYLWTLGLLPYEHPDEVHVVLQDFDVLTDANDSTSLLTSPGLVGKMKTRAMARWCEERGFRATIVERKFASNFRVADDDPPVALCGVDNPMARASLEDVGYQYVIEAGLGAGVQEYLSFQVHTFPAQRQARERWGSQNVVGFPADLVLERPAYRSLAIEGIDECGLTLLAGRTVGASFVGAVTATIVVAELLRLACGGARFEVIDGSLRSLNYHTAIPNPTSAVPFNPGVTPACTSANRGP